MSWRQIKKMAARRDRAIRRMGCPLKPSELASNIQAEHDFIEMVTGNWDEIAAVIDALKAERKGPKTCFCSWLDGHCPCSNCQELIYKTNMALKALEE